MHSVPARAEATAGEGSLPAAVRTLVVSDLHLGARTGVDVLRHRPAARAALLERLDGVDRLVLLGDVLELRHGPLREAVAAARPVLEAIGDAFRGPEVVLVAGNHDHRLVAAWLEQRGSSGRPPPLGLEEHAGPRASAATQAIAGMLAPAALDVAYPGVWLAPGIYATHGHYVDRHSTVPSFERLAAGALGRVLGDRVEDITGPDDYEVVLAPLYALLDAIAARAPDGRGPSHANASTRAWRALAGDARRPLRHRLLAGALPSCAGRACARCARWSPAWGSTRAMCCSATRTAPARSRATIPPTGRCPAAGGSSTAARGSTSARGRAAGRTARTGPAAHSSSRTAASRATSACSRTRTPRGCSPR